MNNIICPDCGGENTRDTLACKHCSADLKLNNKYFLLKILGENIGITYLATEELPNTSVEEDLLKRTVKISLKQLKTNKLVIKELSLRTLEKWRNEELFRRESEILSQLNHKAIPKFIEEFELGIGRNAKSYIVMEYIDGISLRDEFKNKRYTEQEVIEIILGIAKILDYLHSLRPPVVHRDIKLSNIMRKQDNSLAIIDFGSVKNINMSQNATISGTYGFMAPEQFKGDAGFASDFYSLGVIAVVLLSRKEPEEMLENSLELNWKKFVYADEKLKYLLEKLLENDPKKRIKSLAEIDNILNQNTFNPKNTSEQEDKKNSNNAHNTNKNSYHTNILKNEFKRIDGIFAGISDENNYKHWKGNADTILGFGMLGTGVVVWWFFTWYLGLASLIGFVIIFMILTASWYRRKAKKFLETIIKRIDNGTIEDRELTFAVLKSWGLNHGLGDEFIKELNKITTIEIGNKKLSAEKFKNYSTNIKKDNEYLNFTKAYMEEFYSKELST